MTTFSRNQVNDSLSSTALFLIALLNKHTDVAVAVVFAIVAVTGAVDTVTNIAVRRFTLNLRFLNLTLPSSS